MTERVESTKIAGPVLGRREFIAAGTAAAAVAALPLGLRAQTRPSARKLIVVLNSGGWDTTYALDPKPGVTLVDTPEGELRRFAEISVLTHASRPAVAEFFERHAERTAVVNGVQVRSF